jgi:hypothetical protein
MKIENLYDDFEVLISYFGDEELLDLFLESLPIWVKYVTIVDGTFNFAVKNFDLAGIGYSDDARLLKKFPNLKINYIKAVFKDEIEKRKFSYESTRKNFIFVADIDEFFDFDESALLDFVKSNCGAGYFNCINYCTPRHIFSYAINGEKYYDYEKNYPRKFHLFNKEKIKSDKHIDYLWLVNVVKGKPDESLIYVNPLGNLYHASTIRSEKGALVKSVFYKSLHGNNYIYDSKKSKKISDRNLSLDMNSIPYSENAVISCDNILKRNANFVSIIDKLFHYSVNKNNIINFDLSEVAVLFLPFYKLIDSEFNPLIEIKTNEKIIIDLFEYPIHIDKVGYKVFGPERLIIEKNESIKFTEICKDPGICLSTVKLYIHAAKANVNIFYSSF